MVTKLTRRRVILASGWAALHGTRTRFDLDHQVALTDHSDFLQLLEFVEEVDPSRVIPVHGFGNAFAHILKQGGYRAEALHAGTFEEDEGGGEADGTEAEDGIEEGGGPG